VVTDNTYGGTYRLFERVLRKYRLDFSYVDTARPGAVAEAMTPATKMVFLESPTNPVLRVTDLEATAAAAHAHGVTVGVDNTFASPFIQQPLRLGADIVVHSTTKYLNGHSDSVGGVVIVAREEHAEWMRFVQNAAGAIIGPMDAWLVLRGTKTLPLRMARHNSNAQALAEFLDAHPKVARDHYPGLPTHPEHALARRQMRGFGGLIAVELASGDAIDRFGERLAQSGHGEDAPAARAERSVGALGAGVEDDEPVALEARRHVDGLAVLVGARIAARGDDRRDGGARAHSGCAAGERASLRHRGEQIEEGRRHEREHHLRLGIAEAAVELDDPEAALGEHQPGV